MAFIFINSINHQRIEFQELLAEVTFDLDPWMSLQKYYNSEIVYCRIVELTLKWKIRYKTASRAQKMSDKLVMTVLRRLAF